MASDSSQPSSAPRSRAAGLRAEVQRHPLEDRPAHPPAMVLLRYVLPAVVILAGIVVMAMGSETDLEGGGGIVGAGLAIFFINWLFRMGAAGEREREQEDRARE